MERRSVSMILFLSFLTSGVLSLLCLTLSFSEETLNGDKKADSNVLELFPEEVLDTVSFERPVHFTTPEITTTIVNPGTYQVLMAGHNRLKLVASRTKHTVLVEALSTSHGEDVATPIALYVREDEKFPHVVLLLPGGLGLEAVGSYDGSRMRGLRTLQLMPIEIQKALQKKLDSKTK